MTCRANSMKDQLTPEQEIEIEVEIDESIERMFHTHNK